MQKPTGKLRICSQLFPNRAARRQALKEGLGVSTYYLRYFKGLLGLLPEEKRNYPNYEKRNAEIQKKIDVLLQEQKLLRLDFETATEGIEHLDKEISDFLERIENTKTEVQKRRQKIKRCSSLKERLAALIAELSRDGFTEDDFEKMANNQNTEPE